MFLNTLYVRLNDTKKQVCLLEGKDEKLNIKKNLAAAGWGYYQYIGGLYDRQTRHKGTSIPNQQ